MLNRPLQRLVHLLALAPVFTALLPALASEPVRSEQELRAFYQRACALCHGLDGSATAPDGRRLRGRDLTSTEAFRGASDEALAQTIRQGRLFGVIMPAYKRDLSQEEALLLVRNVLRKARKGEAILTRAVPSEPKRAQMLPAPDRR